jgi:hypothetical protein
MRCHDALFDLEFEALLESGRTIQRLPDVVRGRALARARTTMATAATMPTEPEPVVRRRGFVIAMAASVAFVIGAGVATASFYGRAPRSLQPPPPASPSEHPLVHDSALASPASSLVLDPESTARSKPQHAGRMTAAQESYAAELKLLQRAQAAYANRDVSHALTLVVEHGRRFPNGRLAEEREALRIRVLAKSGRTDEADLAAKAFAERFPRSVFLPRLGSEHK